jgi:hypothetical protein
MGYCLCVGASLLAMDVNDDEGCPDGRGALKSFASKLALTLQWKHQVVGDQCAVIDNLALQQ